MSILSNTSGQFTVVLEGQTEPVTYTDYNDIPDTIQALVSFQGDVPPPPHNIGEHEQIAELYAALDETLQKQTGTPPATRIGDADVPHCSGMVRAEGSPNVFLNNIPWSRQTDVNTPHLLPGDPCPTHAAPIAIGSPTVFVNNLGGGRVGDAISGCTQVAAGSPNVFCGP